MPKATFFSPSGEGSGLHSGGRWGEGEPVAGRSKSGATSTVNPHPCQGTRRGGAHEG